VTPTPTSLRDAVLGAAGRVLVDVDGESETVALQPPASPARVAEIERELGFALPRELRDLLAETAGLELLESLDLAGAGPAPWPCDELFGPVLTLAGDGAGNFWVLELRPGTEVLGPVFFVCHDAPVLAYQSPDLATFVGDYLRFAAAPHDGPVGELVRGGIRRIAAQTCDVPRAQLLASEDEVLRAFAESLEGEWFISDLRRARPGDGRPVGRFGPRTPLARAGQELVFAYGSRTRMQRLKTWFTGR
jgi:hypothetical protein